MTSTFRQRRHRWPAVLFPVLAITVVAGAAGVAAGPAPAGATGVAVTPKQLYVTRGGSSGGPCSRAHPCNSLSRAVALADGEPYTFTPVVVNVGRGSFVTHLQFPDKPYPEPDLTIMGASAQDTTLSAGGHGEVLFALADAPEITLENLTVSGGKEPAGTGGGAVHDGGNIMKLSDVVFSGNNGVSNGSGGAVDDDGGIMTVTDSTFTGNSVPSTVGGGGAISDEGGTLTIVASLFEHNDVGPHGSGGAIYANDGRLHVWSSTFEGNSATGTATGGAIGLDAEADTSIVGSTFHDNSAGGAGGFLFSASTFDGKVDLGGNVIVGDAGTGGSICSGPGDVDFGGNVIDASACGVGSKSKVASAAAVGLQPLAFNGGYTRTERIKASSAAHDVVATSTSFAGKNFCNTDDERGEPRRQGPARHCDAGAYQYAPPVITRMTPTKGAPGTTVVLEGYGFEFAYVHFGSAPASYSVSGDLRITMNVPPHSPGGVSISVIDVDGRASKTFDVLHKPVHPPAGQLPPVRTRR